MAAAAAAADSDNQWLLLLLRQTAEFFAVAPRAALALVWSTDPGGKIPPYAT